MTSSAFRRGPGTPRAEVGFGRESYSRLTVGDKGSDLRRVSKPANVFEETVTQLFVIIYDDGASLTRTAGNQTRKINHWDKNKDEEEPANGLVLTWGSGHEEVLVSAPVGFEELVSEIFLFFKNRVLRTTWDLKLNKLTLEDYIYDIL